MGQVKKIGDEYYIEFHARGLLYQQKGGQDKAKALKLLAEIEGKIRRGEMGTIVRDVDIDVFFKTFLDEAIKKYPSKIFKRYAHLSRHFLAFAGSRDPKITKASEITPKVIEDYQLSLRADEKIKPGLINFTLLLLREVLEFARKLGYLNDNPTLHVRFEPMSPVASKFAVQLEKQEKENRILALQEPLRSIAIFACETGLTLSELCALRDIDVNIVHKRINAGVLNKRTVPMTPTAASILQSTLGHGSGKFIFERDGKPRVASQLGSELEKAGVKPATLRYKFACMVLSKKTDLFQLGVLLGFQDVARVMKYFPLYVHQFNKQFSLR